MSPDLLQPPAYVLALAWLASLITSAIKGPVEELLPPTNRWHDLAFTLFPVALSLGLVLGYMATHGGDVFLGVVWGLLSGVGAIGSYLLHTRTGASATTARAPQDRAQRVLTVPAGTNVSVTVPPATPAPAAAPVTPSPTASTGAAAGAGASPVGAEGAPPP